jgi:hypothetical protein
MSCHQYKHMSTVMDLWWTTQQVHGPRNEFWELMDLNDTSLQVDGPPVYFTLFKNLNVSISNKTVKIGHSKDSLLYLIAHSNGLFISHSPNPNNPFNFPSLLTLMCGTRTSYTHLIFSSLLILFPLLLRTHSLRPSFPRWCRPLSLLSPGGDTRPLPLSDGPRLLPPLFLSSPSPNPLLLSFPFLAGDVARPPPGGVTHPLPSGRAHPPQGRLAELLVETLACPRGISLKLCPTTASSRPSSPGSPSLLGLMVDSRGGMIIERAGAQVVGFVSWQVG